ncbi:MAG: DUF5615 family PIN-like protein [Bradymonadales bacterium]|nr:DUF5615 family PIN-like protein [Bradymonadales bacterium]
MPSFLIDEDMPRSLCRVLCDSGIKAVDVRDVGLRGGSDREVFEYALAHQQVLITADMGFSNILQFPPTGHSGIVIARFPNELPASIITRALLQAIHELSEVDWEGNTIIVEPDRLRMRRKR